ncbi:hypothetical protein BD626DRAFT_504493 [Schizophyllum amplum]|uniref:F-box domain-containing protein n=1 Tax=Schizophyllum amplum TaxID=97359 RepID=A0A550C775_9AGAR|nr:hypothetical protein BD626DRAFT_504493 [Auriculariopsis ampla]
MLFTDLPPELVEQVFLNCDPSDVGVLAQCCSYFRSVIYAPDDPPASMPFWRALYLTQPLDDPRASLTQLGLPQPINDDLWRTRLQRLIRAQSLAPILESMLDMISYVVPLPSRCLHTHFGLTRKDHDPARRVRSRAYVYDLRNYRPETEYGPFLPDGGVDWVLMRNLHHVMSMHFAFPELPDDDAVALYPMCLPYTQLMMPEGEKENQDWAGVTGAWKVAFCYCDHRDLIQYNLSGAGDDNSLDETMFEDPGFVEPDVHHPERPTIFFEATNGDMTGIVLQGSVSVTPDDGIRWQFVSGDPPHPIWSCEGVQVGGVRSRFGILGVWTTIFHDEEGPIGPFWLRRNTDTTSTEEDRYVFVTDN